MPALTINGIEVPLAAESLRIETPEEVGAVSRSFAGTLRRSRRALKGAWSADTPWLPAAEARAFKLLLEGAGDHWSFDSSVYSSKGRAPEVLVGGSRETLTPLKGSLGTYLKVPTAGDAQFPLDALAGADGYTCMLWHRHGAGAVRHYVSAGNAVFVDGVQQGSPPSIDGVEFDANLLIGSASGDVYVDDIVILPFVAPSDWPAQVFTNPFGWGGGPAGLRAAGDLLADVGGTARVLATVGEASIVRAGELLVSLSFRLQEV